MFFKVGTGLALYLSDERKVRLPSSAYSTKTSRFDGHSDSPLNYDICPFDYKEGGERW